MIFRTVLVLGAIAIGVTAAVAQQEAVKARKDVMGGIAKPYYGVLARMNRGQMPYDQAAASAALNLVAAESQKVATAFTPNVQPATQSDYDASPKIWQNKADFDAKAAAFVKAVADNKDTVKNLDTFKVAFQNISKACDACHETYRVKNR
jgi:cytochrome c556